MALCSSFATALLILAPVLCMGQEFNPSEYGLPEFLPESEEFSDLCMSFTESGPPLPTDLPRQFSMHVEANILNKNRTVMVHELYDDVNNRGSLMTISNGVREHVIFDYDDNEIFVFPDAMSGRECVVHPLTESRMLNFTFGITRVNGSIHIGTTSAFLGLPEGVPTMYQGLDRVRGTPALHWSACINGGPNVSFLADYYYTTTDSWSYATITNPGDFNMTLTQIVVRGNSFFRNTLNNFYHVYSVFGFQSGPDSVPDRAFSVPTGLACVGRNPGMPVPSVPNFFSTYIQYIDRRSELKQVAIAREYYDFTHQLFRTDSYYDGQMGGNAGPVSIIHDFDTQLQYIIYRRVSSCNITALSDSFSGDVIFDDDGNPQLIPPSRFFLLGRDFNYSYEGVTTVRGVEVDSWIAIVDFLSLSPYSNLTGGAVEVFFTRPGYNISTDRSAGGSQVPWRVNVRGLLTYAYEYFNVSGSMDVDYELDYFDFSASEPPYDAFDVSFCSDPDESLTLGLRFEVPLEGIDFRTFRTNLRASLVDATKLKPVQVNNIHIIDHNATHIFVVLHFTNISDMAQISNMDLVVTADGALKTLQSLADDNMLLQFQVNISNGKMVSPVLVTSNRGRMIACNATCEECPSTTSGTTSTPKPEDNITNRLGLSDGVVAGIAVGLFFAGFIFALIFVCGCFTFVKCCMGKESREVSSVKYQKHDDELEDLP